MKALLPDQIRLSQVHLRTANLERALAFYTNALGFKASPGPGFRALLSAGPGPELIVLSEDPQAPPHPPRSAGLYHFALRYPTRHDLAQAFRRLVMQSYPVDGASDHGVSEAIYLRDPEGNGIELYADRPRANWTWRDGQVEMQTRALSLDNLLATVTDQPAKMPPLQVDLGHIHLQVRELDSAERFYGEFLGFSITQRSVPGALFFAAGGYHHHLAVNVWGVQPVGHGRRATSISATTHGRARSRAQEVGHGKISPAPPSECIGLISYRFEVPVAEMLYCLGHRAPLLGYQTRLEQVHDGPTILQIRDPNGNWLEVQPTSTATASRLNPAFEAGAATQLRSSHLQAAVSNK